MVRARKVPGGAGRKVKKARIIQIILISSKLSLYRNLQQRLAHPGHWARYRQSVPTSGRSGLGSRTAVEDGTCGRGLWGESGRKGATTPRFNSATPLQSRSVIPVVTSHMSISDRAVMSAPYFLMGGGEMGARLRQFAWDESPLGLPETWPRALQWAVNVCLNSSFPSAIYWSRDHLLLYNDAWIPVAGDRHPHALGCAARDVWPDIWSVIEPQFAKVHALGEGLAYFDQMLPMLRHDNVTETFWNYGLTPLKDERGHVVGIFNQGNETTHQVIRERAQAEELVKQRRMFEQAPGFITILSGPEHRFEFVNDAYRQTFGERVYLGNTVLEAFPELVGQGYQERLDEVYRSGRRFVAEGMPIQLASAGQPLRYLDFVYEPLLDDQGQVNGVFCEGFDTTEAHHARIALSRSEEKFRTALEIETVGALFFDMNGKIIDANAGFMHASGYSIEELRSGASWHMLTPKEWQHVSSNALDELRRTGQTAPYEKEYVRKDGSRWWGVCATKLMPDGTAFELVVDITDRVEAEGALMEETRTLGILRELNEKFASDLDLERIVQSLTDAGTELTGAQFGSYFHNVLDDTGQYLKLFTLSGAERAAFENLGHPRATDIFGPTFRNEGVVRSDDILADPRYGRFAPHQGMPKGHLPVRSYLAISVVSRSGEVLGGLFFGHAEPGQFSERHERLLVALAAQAAIAIDNAQLFRQVQQANETLEVRVAQRTEELTHLHEALRQSQKMEALGQLTGGIAHDFNNLLTGILGSAELLQRKLEQGQDKGRDRLINAIQVSAKRAAALTQRLLAFSRRQTLDPKPVLIHSLVEGMEELISRSVGPAIEVRILADGANGVAKIDAAQLESALLNLAINSRDAMPAGGVITICSQVMDLDAFAASRLDLLPGEYMAVTVSDTGMGIAASDIKRIFDPFFTTKPLGQGTGLGLSMVHGFVRQSGGQVEVVSEEGQGTRIRLLLPRFHGSAQDETRAEGVTFQNLAEGEHARILVVDDEPTVRMLVVETLREAGYLVADAEDGNSAVQALEKAGRIDLLVTDVGLPGGLNGRQVADLARVSRPGLKVLFITGYAETSVLGDDFITGAMEVITKPFTVSSLVGKVRAMLNVQAGG